MWVPADQDKFWVQKYQNPRKQITKYVAKYVNNLIYWQI